MSDFETFVTNQVKALKVFKRAHPKKHTCMCCAYWWTKELIKEYKKLNMREYDNRK